MISEAVQTNGMTSSPPSSSASATAVPTLVDSLPKRRPPPLTDVTTLPQIPPHVARTLPGYKLQVYHLDGSPNGAGSRTATNSTATSPPPLMATTGSGPQSPPFSSFKPPTTATAELESPQPLPKESRPSEQPPHPPPPQLKPKPAVKSKRSMSVQQQSMLQQPPLANIHRRSSQHVHHHHHHHHKRQQVDEGKHHHHHYHQAGRPEYSAGSTSTSSGGSLPRRRKTSSREDAMQDVDVVSPRQPGDGGEQEPPPPSKEEEPPVVATGMESPRGGDADIAGASGASSGREELSSPRATSLEGEEPRTLAVASSEVRDLCAAGDFGEEEDLVRSEESTPTSGGGGTPKRWPAAEVAKDSSGNDANHAACGQPMLSPAKDVELTPEGSPTAAASRPREEDSLASVASSSSGSYSVTPESEQRRRSEVKRREEDAAYGAGASERETPQQRRKELTLDLLAASPAPPSEAEEATPTSEAQPEALPDTSTENAMVWQRMQLDTGDVRKKRKAFEEQIQSQKDDTAKMTPPSIPESIKPKVNGRNG